MATTKATAAAPTDPTASTPAASPSPVAATEAATLPASPRRGLRVVARPDSFWRAGKQFTHEPRTIPLDDLSDDQVKEIKGEPLLVVSEVDIADT